MRPRRSSISNDGDTDRIVLACEALEECAPDCGAQSTGAVSVVGHRVAWRLARRAGVKLMQVQAVAPLLSSLAESAISSVLQRAVSAACTVDPEHRAAVSDCGGIRVCGESMRRAIKTDPLLFGCSCVGVGRVPTPDYWPTYRLSLSLSLSLSLRARASLSD
eukprot:COSAG03_NODE_1626_length_3751_cov_2.605148_2_plen_162_part_00